MTTRSTIRVLLRITGVMKFVLGALNRGVATLYARAARVRNQRFDTS
jgi:hypothetical protein